jgi:epoxyqueuosine reductase
MTPAELAQALKQNARQLGFTLAGITNPGQLEHFDIFRDWLNANRQAQMTYLADKTATERRADPKRILPECRSILVLGIPYSNPTPLASPHFACASAGGTGEPQNGGNEGGPHGRVAAYAWGADYHLVLPERLQALVAFLEAQVGHPIPNRWYTDTGPVLERDLAMRAGLGWIGKNTCLINPQSGSYFLLAEILLGLDLPPDPPFTGDRCGSCARCIDACPTACILPDRTIDAGRCISYLTIENKAEIPEDLRPLMGDWLFGCDICQMVCPWNIRFAQKDGTPVFAARPGLSNPLLAGELQLTPREFSRKFKDSPVKRAKRRGYLRNAAVAAANSGQAIILPALKSAARDDEALIREHAEWAIKQLEEA